MPNKQSPFDCKFEVQLISTIIGHKPKFEIVSLCPKKMNVM